MHMYNTLKSTPSLCHAQETLSQILGSAWQWGWGSTGACVSRGDIWGPGRWMLSLYFFYLYPLKWKDPRERLMPTQACGKLREKKTLPGTMWEPLLLAPGWQWCPTGMIVYPRKLSATNSVHFVTLVIASEAAMFNSFSPSNVAMEYWWDVLSKWPRFRQMWTTWSQTAGHCHTCGHFYF